MKEIWKDIKGFENLYRISNYGRVKQLNFKNSRNTVILNNRKNNYYNVSLKKDNKIYTKYIHKLVAEHFIPNDDNHKYIKFIDNDRYNCNYKNLKWSNTYSTIKTGKIRCNETNEVFISQSSAAYNMCLSPSNICSHLNGKRKRVGRTINGVREYFTFKYI